MINYIVATGLESLIAIMPLVIWAIILAFLIILFFFLGRATSLPWLIKYHVRHIKDAEVLRLTIANEQLEKDYRELKVHDAESNACLNGVTSLLNNRRKKYENK